MSKEKLTAEDVKDITREMLGKVAKERIEKSQAKAREVVPSIAKANVPEVEGTIQPTGNGIDAARCVRYLMLSNMDPQRAADMAKKEGAEYIYKAMTSGDMAAGGALVPPEFSRSIIAELGPMAVVRSLNPKILPLAGGSITLPFLDTAPDAAYVQESARRTKTEATTGQLQLAGKKLIAIVPLSNDLIRRGGPQAENSIRDSLVRSLGRKEDITFIRDNGASGNPKGLYYWAPSANLIAANGTVNVANVAVDLSKAELALEDADVPMNSPGWIMCPREYHYFRTAQDGNGNYVWRDEILVGRLNGYPVRKTTQIPKTLGGGTESEIYMVDFASVVIAEEESLMIDTSKDASYWDGSASQSSFDRDQTLIRAIAIHDLGCEYRGKEVAVLTTVKYGV